MPTKTLRLPVPLDDTERLSVGAEMSAAVSAYEEVEAEKKEATKGFNATLKEHRATIHRLNVSLSTGTIEREVDVEEFEDLETGTIKTRRLDTNEIITTRGMDPEERQLKIGGTSLDEVNAKLAALNGAAEEQLAAGTPQEAEQLRDARLAEEAATAAFDSLTTGSDVEILIGAEWIRFAVENKTEFSFEANNRVYDVSKHGVSWRLKPTWSDLVAVSAEAARLAEIDRLAADQAADKPKTLLQNPRKKNGAAKRVDVQDGNGATIARGGDEAPPAAPTAELCAPACEADHQHTEQRTAF